MAFNHDTMRDRAQDLRGQVLEILDGHVGAENAIKAGEIAGRLGLTGRYADRPVREAIRLLRQDGHLILSSVRAPYGYFIAASLDEWREYGERSLKPRALDILSTLKAMTEAARRRFGAEAEVIQLRMGL